jgi:hypothetical protein
LRISSLGVVDVDTDCDGNAILKFDVSVSEFKSWQVAMNDATDKKLKRWRGRLSSGQCGCRLAVAVSEGL